MGLGKLVRAKILIYGENGLAKKTVSCTFNPSQYVIKNSVNYKEEQELGADLSRLLYLSGNKSELSLTLYFDSATDDGQELMVAGIAKDAAASAVTDKTEQLVKAMRVEGSQHRPSQVAFQWGNLLFKGVITSLTETFTMFDPFGKPIRAKVDMTLKAEEDLKTAKLSEPFESPDRTKVTTIIEGMSLWQLAYEEYGDCEKWREIARANHLMNPLDIRPGQKLKIPAL